MHKVTFLLFDDMMASSISLPMEMLNAADNLRRVQQRGSLPLKIALAAEQLLPVRCSSGLHLLPDTRLDELEDSDLLVIPGLWRNPQQLLRKQQGLLHWLAGNIDRHRRICAVGTGSTLLADTHVLDNKPATTHWFYFDLMEKKYPAVQWKRQHLITQASQLYCAGSINSVADLTIHFIEQGFSASIARRVESQFSPEIRRAYDSHLFDNSPTARHDDELIADCQHTIRQHYASTINFATLAAGLGISSRSLQRRFVRATGFSPLQYQQYIRIQHARELLQNSNLNIQDIAELIGYVDASHFAAVFRRITEQSPQAWRQAVRGKLFKA